MDASGGANVLGTTVKRNGGFGHVLAIDRATLALVRQTGTAPSGAVCACAPSSLSSCICVCVRVPVWAYVFECASAGVGAWVCACACACTWASVLGKVGRLTKTGAGGAARGQR
jgi:hypothetical protein